MNLHNTMDEMPSKLVDEIEIGTIPIDDCVIALLNELLIRPGHYAHQRIAFLLQGIKSPSTVPFVRKALESNFDYLEYSRSDSGVIAKWFSWVLFSIGTEEAINLLKEYTQSPDEEIRNEMIYRLSRVK